MGSRGNGKVGEGDPVLLRVEQGWKRRTYSFRARRKAVYATFAGPIRGDEIVGKPWGYAGRVGRAIYYVLPPLHHGYLESFARRRSQVIYPKDSGYMVVRAGLRPGSRVFEAGLGSGFLTRVIALAVCPTGRIYAVEARGDMLETALDNLRALGLDGCLEARLGDVRKGVGATGLDAGFLDMPDPWNALDAAREALRPGAPLVVFLPTMTQLDKLADAVEAHPFFMVEDAVEILLREVEMVPGAVRPSPRMIGHTGYIVVLRALANPKPLSDDGENGGEPRDRGQHDV